MSGRLVLLAALASGLVLGTTVQADTRKLAADGTVHAIDLQNVGGGKNQGTALRHTRYLTSGAVQTALVPGTEDTVIDREPSIEIDAAGKLVLVWSRHDGGNYNVFLSRWSGSWSAPVPVFRAPGDDVEPQLKISANYVHVAWRKVSGGRSDFYRSSFLSSTLAEAYGPELVVTDDLWPVPSEGATTAGTYDPPKTEEIFAGVSFTGIPSDPGRCGLWGVRDEPVPIGYRELLLLPLSVRSATAVQAGYLGGKFTVTYVSGPRLYYATRSSGVWSPTRSIELAGGVTASDARWIVRDMNSRSDGY